MSLQYFMSSYSYLDYKKIKNQRNNEKSASLCEKMCTIAEVYDISEK